MSAHLHDMPGFKTYSGPLATCPWCHPPDHDHHPAAQPREGDDAEAEALMRRVRWPLDLAKLVVQERRREARRDEALLPFLTALQEVNAILDGIEVSIPSARIREKVRGAAQRAKVALDAYERAKEDP